MSEWALQLRSNDLEPVGALWHVPGVDALLDGSRIWLKGQGDDDATLRKLQCLPCDGRYDVLPGGVLRKPAHRVPQGFLPAGPWQPLHKFFTVTLPPASIAARQHARVTVQLAPSAGLSEPNLLLTDLNSWAQYANRAPQVRLRCCQFAVSSDRRVVVLGDPLPPIAGARAVVRSGLVTPCGWSWSPAVDAELLALAWGVEPGDLWLMWPGKPIERVPVEQLVAASRSAVQQTWEALSHA